ncbi:MAG: ABC transporter substrate-binding protein [Desulfovibrio sp.]|uniref:ABC transporter substrate-binding protein n=1 Tax=Desulfovibrio sp. 7SRBS1 TaxID=3378064 RepID=UPI003B410934
MKRLSLFFALCLLSALLLAQTAHARTITDMAGRTVQLPDKVERIVTSFSPGTLFVLCAGLGDRLVGADNQADKQTLFQAVIGDRKVGKVGNRTSGLNLEAIVALKPDLVVLYAQKDGHSIADKLDQLGIASLIIKPESINDMKHILSLLSQACGVEEEVGKVVAAMDDMLHLAHDRTQDIAPKDRATVYYCAPQGPLSTVSGQMLQDEMISLAGGINASHELNGFFQRVSPEQIVKWNPDVIVFSRRLVPSRLKIFQGEQFASIPAVKNGRLHRFPSEMVPWDFPSPLSVPGVLWLAGKTYPDRFADVDMKQRTAEFYDMIFGKGFSAKHHCTDDVN